jgi:hypothetical protein
LDNQLDTYAVPGEFSVTAEFVAIARANAAFIESDGRADDPSLGYSARPQWLRRGNCYL